MQTLPVTVGIIHLVGIGGIGMSGIAEVLHTLGYPVQGSDLAENANVKRLRSLGITVFIGQKPEHVTGAGVVVVSSAVKADNPEVQAARQSAIPVVRRAEMLAELMRLKWAIAVAGTHGKTTTTSIVAAMLDHAGHDPTVINGGIINAWGTNARLGKGDWMIVEADESDGTFIRIPATIAIVTNIDPEHLDHWGSFDALRDAFLSFVENLPFYGLGVLCIDHPEVQALIGRIRDRRVVTYGLSRQADIRLTDIAAVNGHSRFSVEIGERVRGGPLRLDDLALPMVGRHNVMNALSAIAVAQELEIPAEQIRGGLRSFAGVKRRFTKTGTVGGVTVIDDYGHHPVEIAAVLKSARDSAKGRVIAVVQPHRYSRLNALFEGFCTCFNDADTVLVAPVFSAGEAPIEGAENADLVDGLIACGHRDARVLPGPEALAPMIGDTAEPGDMVICLGAGSITAWANALPQQLADRKSEGRKAAGAGQ